MELLLPAAIGLVVGTVVGALGGGGGILTVPILVYLLGQGPQAAATGSLMIVGATSLVSLVPHARHGHVRWRDGLTFGVLGAVLAFIGARLSVRVAPDLLMALFATLLLVVAVLMVRRAVAARRRGRGRPHDEHDEHDEHGVLEPSGLRGDQLDDDGHGRVWRVTHSRPFVLLLAASVVGLLTGFFGVGGGFAVIPALVLALRIGMRDAVGTSLLVIVLNSVTGLLGRLEAIPTVDWPVVGAFAVASMVGGVVGTRISERAPAERLTLAFAILLVLVSLGTAVQAFPALLR